MHFENDVHFKACLRFSVAMRLAMRRPILAGVMLTGIISLPLFDAVAFAADYPPSTRDAEEVDPALASVRSRPREDYRPIGVPVGSFIFYPELRTSLSYDSNITASGSDPKSDWIFVVKPIAQLQSDWLRHYLAFDAFYESGNYFKYSDGDYQNYSFGTQGRLDISRDTYVSGYARYLHGHELPGDGETDTDIALPLPFDRTTAGVKFDNRFNRMWTVAAFDFQDTEYADTLDGAPTFQDYRDGQTYTAWGRIGYDISPLTSVFVGASYAWGEFDDTDFNGKQYTVTTGLKFEPSRLMRGEAFVGYKSWTSDSGDLDDVSGVTYGVNLAWFVTPLVTMTFTGNQTVDSSNYTPGPPYDDTLIGSSVLTSNAGVRVDYEFRRNILLGSWFAYQNQDYGDYPRDDDKYTYGASLTYLINRYWTAGLQYTYTDFSSNFNGINGVEDYTRNVVMGNLKLAY
jgi:hypothetical protein